MILLLSLLIVTQHPVPIEPDAMSSSWALGVPRDMPYAEVDNTKQSDFATNYDDSSHDVTGYYSTDDIWPIKLRGFVVEPELQQQFEADFAEWEQNYTYPQIPVRVVWMHNEVRYIVTAEHEMHFYVPWLNCRDCWEYHSLNDEFGQQVKTALNDSRYTAYVIRRDLWPTRHFSYAELRGKQHIFKAPWQLRYQVLRVEMSDNKKPASTVPLWVRVRLGDNKNWINRAERALGDMTWEGFFARHGYIPGDRSPADMQYNYALRMGMPWSERLRRETPPCEPEFGERGHGPGGRYTACAESLYEDERQATRNERDWATQLVERYLGGN
jgi:hypothetical protein